MADIKIRTNPEVVSLERIAKEKGVDPSVILKTVEEHIKFLPENLTIQVVGDSCESLKAKIIEQKEIIQKENKNADKACWNVFERVITKYLSARKIDYLDDIYQLINNLEKKPSDNARAIQSHILKLNSHINNPGLLSIFYKSYHRGRIKHLSWQSLDFQNFKLNEFEDLTNALRSLKSENPGLTLEINKINTLLNKQLEGLIKRAELQGKVPTQNLKNAISAIPDSDIVVLDLLLMAIKNKCPLTPEIIKALSLAPLDNLYLFKLAIEKKQLSIPLIEAISYIKTSESDKLKLFETAIRANILTSPKDVKTLSAVTGDESIRLLILGIEKELGKDICYKILLKVPESKIPLFTLAIQKNLGRNENILWLLLDTSEKKIKFVRFGINSLLGVSEEIIEKLQKVPPEKELLFKFAIRNNYTLTETLYKTLRELPESKISLFENALMKKIPVEILLDDLLKLPTTKPNLISLVLLAIQKGVNNVDALRLLTKIPEDKIAVISKAVNHFRGNDLSILTALLAIPSERKDLLDLVSIAIEKDYLEDTDTLKTFLDTPKENIDIIPLLISAFEKNTNADVVTTLMEKFSPNTKQLFQKAIDHNLIQNEEVMSHLFRVSEDNKHLIDILLLSIEKGIASSPNLIASFLEIPKNRDDLISIVGLYLSKEGTANTELLETILKTPESRIGLLPLIKSSLEKGLNSTFINSLIAEYSPNKTALFNLAVANGFADNATIMKELLEIEKNKKGLIPLITLALQKQIKEEIILNILSKTPTSKIELFSLAIEKDLGNEKTIMEKLESIPNDKIVLFLLALHDENLSNQEFILKLAKSIDSAQISCVRNLLEKHWIKNISQLEKILEASEASITLIDLVLENDLTPCVTPILLANNNEKKLETMLLAFRKFIEEIDAIIADQSMPKEWNFLPFSKSKNSGEEGALLDQELKTLLMTLSFIKESTEDELESLSKALQTEALVEVKNSLTQLAPKAYIALKEQAASQEARHNLYKLLKEKSLSIDLNISNEIKKASSEQIQALTKSTNLLGTKISKENFDCLLATILSIPKSQNVIKNTDNILSFINTAIAKGFRSEKIVNKLLSSYPRTFSLIRILLENNLLKSEENIIKAINSPIETCNLLIEIVSKNLDLSESLVNQIILNSDKLDAISLCRLALKKVDASTNKSNAEKSMKIILNAAIEKIPRLFSILNTNESLDNDVLKLEAVYKAESLPREDFSIKMPNRSRDLGRIPMRILDGLIDNEAIKNQIIILNILLSGLERLPEGTEPDLLEKITLKLLEKIESVELTNFTENLLGLISSLLETSPKPIQTIENLLKASDTTLEIILLASKKKLSDPRMIDSLLSNIKNLTPAQINTLKVFLNASSEWTTADFTNVLAKLALSEDSKANLIKQVSYKKAELSILIDMLDAEESQLNLIDAMLKHEESSKIPKFLAIISDILSASTDSAEITLKVLPFLPKESGKFFSNINRILIDKNKQREARIFLRQQQASNPEFLSTIEKTAASASEAAKSAAEELKRKVKGLFPF